MKTTTIDTLDFPARLFKACSDPVRLRLLNLLGGREVCVCHLHEALALPQPTVSRHLAYLRKVGLVTPRKEGLWVHYRLSRPAAEFHRKLIECVKTLESLSTFEHDVIRLSRLTRC
jgi:ArsR family transcriptional regulator